MKLVSLETVPGPNISYPFHVQNVEADLCAIQALVLCERKRPICKITVSHCCIQTISYSNQSFRLVDFEFFDTSCFASLLFRVTLSISHFWTLILSPYHADLHLCTKPFTVDYRKSHIACASNGTHYSFVAFVLQKRAWILHEYNVRSARKEEEELSQTVQNVGYEKLSREGFQWNGIWMVARSAWKVLTKVI